MAPSGLTSNDTLARDFPPVLYYVGRENTIQRQNQATGAQLIISAPDSNTVNLQQLNDFDFCASIKNSLDPAGKQARGAHTMENFLVLYSSRKFAIERAKERESMSVFMIDPKELVPRGLDTDTSTPALYDLHDLINRFDKTHLSEFQIHWEVEYYVDEAGCYLAFDHIAGRSGNTGIATSSQQHNDPEQPPFQRPVITHLPRTEYPYVLPRFVKGLKPLGVFYCARARHYVSFKDFPTNPTTTNGRSGDCYRHKSDAWKAENPFWPLHAGLENGKVYGYKDC